MSRLSLIVFVAATRLACSGAGRVEVPFAGSLATAVGVVVSDSWQLDANGDGRFDGCAVDRCLRLGSGVTLPLVGDWDGDGRDAPGAFDPATATFTLARGGAPLTFSFGRRGDIPVVGDWDGDGVDTVGVFAPLSATFALRRTNAVGEPDEVVSFGLPGDVPLAGDWDGDGRDTLGVYRQAEARFLLQGPTLRAGVAASLVLGEVGDLPLVGDWNGDRRDSVGVYDVDAGDVTVLDTLGASEGRTLPFGVAHARPVAGRF